MNDDGRTVINAQVTIICSESETPVAGTLELETVGAELPWRHWKIVNSEIVKYIFRIAKTSPFPNVPILVIIAKQGGMGSFLIIQAVQ